MVKLNYTNHHLDLGYYEDGQEIPCHLHFKSASNESVMTVLGADINDDDGRSEWFWVRVPNGDLMLATFPQGDTYFFTEGDH